MCFVKLLVYFWECFFFVMLIDLERKKSFFPKQTKGQRKRKKKQHSVVLQHVIYYIFIYCMSLCCSVVRFLINNCLLLSAVILINLNCPSEGTSDESRLACSIQQLFPLCNYPDQACLCGSPDREHGISAAL